MEPSDGDINSLRQAALNKLGDNHQGQDAHPKDLERLKKDNRWLRRFLLHNDLDMEKSLTMLLNSLKWRHKMGVNDITHSNINQDILNLGSMFPYGKDKDGRSMLVIKAKLGVKGAYKAEDIQKVLVYWFERLERQVNGQSISIFFEMTGAGLSNMDMEFVQYLISLFRDYYPSFLNYIIIFEMSWILNAAWKVIKSLMPAKSVQLVKFVGRSDLKDFVPVSEQLDEWGGKVSYRYVFQPEKPSSDAVGVNGQTEDARRKVHFAEDSTSNDSASIDAADVVKTVPPGNAANSLPSPSSHHNRHRTSSTTGQLLQFTPAEEIVFRRENGETAGSLTTTNTSQSAIAYKIKTTSPDKYRVRPSAGVIRAGAVMTASVQIQSGYATSRLVRDKFLIMACAVDSESLSAQQLNEIWKKTPERSVQQFRLRCSVAPSDAQEDDTCNAATWTNVDKVMKALHAITPQMEQVLQEQKGVRERVKRLETLLMVVVCLLSILLFYVVRL